MKVDLHLHTTYSDGSLTPKEVIDRAKQLGICAVAITDHDECKGCLDIGEEKDMIVLCGIELSADFKGEAHVLGYNIDCTNKSLVEHIERQNRSRRIRAEKMVVKLNELGIDVTMEEVIEECKGDVLGRPHIADALIKKGVVGSVKEAFIKFLERNAMCYVPREKTDIALAADLIKEAGGKPVLAHPGNMPRTSWRELSGKLSDFGFWGIEAYHPSHSAGQCREFESFAKQNGFFVTAGSDFHGASKLETDIGQEQRGGEFLEKSLRELGIVCR